MKILFDHQIFSRQRYGGISRYIFQLANVISKTENVYINSPIYINDYISTADVQGRISVVGFRCRILENFPSIVRLVNFVIARFFTRYIKPDILHETYYSSKSLRVNCPVILTVHDMIHELFPQYFSYNDRTSFNKKVSVDRADHIICVSQCTKNDLVKLFNVDPEKVSVVHLGFELDYKADANINQPSKPYILYVGSRSGYKNFEMLLRIFGETDYLKNNYLLVAFGGGGWTTRELELFNDLSIDFSSILHVSGDDSVLAFYYKNATAFVYPSLYEGFGIPPLEAMSYGCPVVCSNGGSIPEVVGDAALVFDPCSDESLRNALESVIHNVNLRNDIIKKGKERIKIFSWEKCSEQTIAVYSKVLKNGDA